MTKKFFSLIIVPHHKGKSKTITLTEKKVKILAGVIAVLFIGSGILLVDYFMMSGTRQKYRELYRENSEQKGMIARLKVSMNKLRTDVEHFENYAKKINIMAGLKSPEVLREIGVGGGGRGDQELNFSEYNQNLTLTQAENLGQKTENIEKNLNTLVRLFESRHMEIATMPTIWPTTGWLTSPYGERIDPFTGKKTFHYGVDIASGYGNPVVTTADGKVIELKREKIGGNTIIIQHGAGGFTTVYCHLSKFNCKIGQSVKRGDVIGYVGSTGKALGPHVHYEVRKNGKAVNPWNYLLEE